MFYNRVKYLEIIVPSAIINSLAVHRQKDVGKKYAHLVYLYLTLYLFNATKSAWDCWGLLFSRFLEINTMVVAVILMLENFKFCLFSISIRHFEFLAAR